MGWLGLTATATKVIGWIFVAIAIVLLGILIWYLVKNLSFQKERNDIVKTPEKNIEKFEEITENNIQKKESVNKQVEEKPKTATKSSVVKKKTATPKKTTTRKTITKKTTSSKTKSKQ